ncbi:MAG: hypothetical protein ONB16_03755 [candidate division KSB1 bacterium]|nr:hypothetical protein [candidate division KSB1 bacterium]MDZ7319642.1 hypothetical protein [candidate division KSB1 bacterium]MDZ7342276.1 hypothetical protein [candidate division KSB1 bacterium]
METANPRLKKAFLEVVSNQLRDNDPPETRQTLTRLMVEGYTRAESMELIAAVVSAHIYDMFKRQRHFDPAKYVHDLNKLPQMPWER